MKDLKDTRHLSWDDWDELQRPAPEVTDFDKVVDEAVSRRGFLGGLIAMGSGAAVFNLMGSTAVQAHGAGGFPFKPIPIYTDFDVHVPEGHSWQVLARWGDPLFSDVPEFDPTTGGTAESQLRAFGENTDGMELFHVDGKEIIAINHEYANTDENLPQNPDGEVLSAEDVAKLQALQGVSVMEIAQGPDGWAIVKDSSYNRRITHNTPMKIAGPAAGHDLLKTAADPTGTLALGTFNNCGSGRTPWGTYLTCEENFNGYFGSSDETFARPEAFARYGIGLEGRYAYETFDVRFDIAQNPNEPNRAGYVVEIDPSAPGSMPVKRTALGRFKHENAAFALTAGGNPVVYLGDDERGEYLYKFVSSGVYVEGGETEGLLDDGQLFVAKFETDGTGTWVPLDQATTGMDQAMVCIHTRLAASAAGGTTMDRPEWVAVSPVRAEAYCCLTNNSRRAADFTNAGGDPVVPVEGSPNPRAENRYGQIVRWYPAGADHGAARFTWDLYVMAGNPLVHDDANAGSDNINAGNLFNSPDGMQIDSHGLIWIQTDGNDSNEDGFEGMGNNQMLVGDPVTGEIQRFMTGPNGSEVTGLTWSTDRKTAFVGIQHPGGTWPDGDGVPRSAVIAITRDDGAVIG